MRSHLHQAPRGSGKPGKTWQLTGLSLPLATGLAVGCLLGVLAFNLRDSTPEARLTRTDTTLEPPPAIPSPAPVEAVASDPPLYSPSQEVTASLAESMTPEDEVLDSLMPVADEIILDEFVVNPSPRIELETRDVWVSGRAVAAVISLKRTGSKKGPARVRWKTIPGTATPAKDYESKSTTVKFADGQATRTVFVPLIPQPSGSEPRTFSIVLERAPAGSALGSVTRTDVTIGDG